MSRGGCLLGHFSKKTSITSSQLLPHSSFYRTGTAHHSLITWCDMVDLEIRKDINTQKYLMSTRPQETPSYKGLCKANESFNSNWDRRYDRHWRHITSSFGQRIKWWQDERVAFSSNVAIGKSDVFTGINMCFSWHGSLWGRYLISSITLFLSLCRWKVRKTTLK